MAAAFFAALPTGAGAAPISTSSRESFSYTTGDDPANDTADGDLLGNTGGTGFGGAWTTSTATPAQPDVTADSLTYGLISPAGNKITLNGPQNGTGTRNPFRPLAQNIDAGTFYLSFLVRKENDTNRTINFALFSGTTTERIAVGQFGAATGTNQSGGNIAVNIRPTGDNLTQAATPIPLGLNQTRLLVLRVDFDENGTNERVRLYVDPVGRTEPATAYIDRANLDLGAAVGISHIRPFTGAVSTGGDPVVTLPAAVASFDEIHVGPTFASVVPEPASLGLLTIAAGGLLARRRRPA